MHTNTHTEPEEQNITEYDFSNTKVQLEWIE